jgi:hypothetical protein
MAKTSGFLFTNTTPESSTSVAPIQMGLVSNYAVERDTARMAVLNNKTAPIDAQELVTYSSRDIATINTDLSVQNPARVKAGVLYTIQVQDTLVTTDSSDPTYRVDEPIVASLSIRHGKSGNITSSIVASVVARLIGACRHNDGSWRFDDLMRSAEKPVAN